jgi:hypothetical protein
LRFDVDALRDKIMTLEREIERKLEIQKKTARLTNELRDKTIRKHLQENIDYY